MNVDMNQLPGVISDMEKLVTKYEAQRLQHRHPLLHHAAGAAKSRIITDVHDDAADLKTDILHTYLNLFINGPTTNDFTMQALPDNRNAPKTCVQNLYEVVNPSKFYHVQMKAIEWAMSKLPYDINLNDDPTYLTIVSGLMKNRQPVTEVGDFGTLPEFLSQEGSFWLLPQSNGTYHIDLTRYKKYAVRDNYRPYGCLAVVDAKFNVVTIDDIPAADSRFGVAMSVFKSTLILDVILHVHASLSHLLVSQKLYMAATTTYYDAISKDPELSQLYYLCTYRTNEINSNIPILAGTQGSLVQMAFGFTSDAFLQMLTDLLTDPTLQNPADIKNFLITSRSEQWKRIAEPVYAVVERFVERVIGNKLPDDFKLQTKVSLFVSTFYHEMVGDFQLKTIYNCDLNARTYTGDKFARRTSEFAYIIAATTMGVSMRILKLQELVKGTYLSGESLAAWTELYEGFQAALKAYPWINVDNFEFSVGY